MEYQLSNVRKLRGMQLRAADGSEAELAKVRGRLLECLTALGADVSAAPAMAADGPGLTALLWADDHAYDVSVFAIPDDAISPAQRAALSATPFCFANESDCDEPGWLAAVRIMAAIGDGGSAEDLYAIGLEESDMAELDGAPTREELETTWESWQPHLQCRLAQGGELGWLAGRFTAVHAFNKAM